MRSARRASWAAAFLLCVGRASAAGLEYPDVYKIPRAIGMGNADVAAGDHADALFTNPAGLIGVAEGWRVAPLTLTLASSVRTEGFVGRLVDALDIDDVQLQRETLVEVLRRYRGENMHAEAVFVPSASWRRGNLAVGAAWLGAVKLDGRSHQGFGETGFLEADARTLSGLVTAVAYRRDRLRVGATLKRLRRYRLNRTYSVRELVDLTQAGRSITDDRVDGSDLGLDLGLQYDLSNDAAWRPRLGLAIQNVGGMAFDEAGRFPPTVTVGLSVRPMARPLTISAEYFDLLHRLPQDDDERKRVRLGAEWRRSLRLRGSLALRAGIYQGSYTSSVEWSAGIVTLGLHSYAEEQGAHAGQDDDRRYVFSVGVEL